MENQLHPHEMTNSHLLVQEFDYLEATSVENAIDLLKQYDGQARLLAGGTDLLVMMKLERIAPKAVINISKIQGLGEINENHEDGSLSIGALVGIWSIGKHPLIARRYPALAEACASFGSTQVETMGTIGGNLCNGSPAADTAPILIALGAQLTIIGAHGKRSLPVEEFYYGPRKTALAQDELLVEVTLPALPNNTSSAFLKESRVASDLAKASLGMRVTRKNDTITAINIAMGSVAPKPIRLVKAESVLLGQRYSTELALTAGEVAADEITPIDDNRSTSQYRRQITRVMVQDALAIAWKRTFEPFPLDVPVKPIANNHRPLPYIDCIKVGQSREIELIVNGRKVKVWVASNELLVNVLREKLELSGTKYACGIGECGACSVLIDGKPMLSCLILAVTAVGKAITTVEGLQDPLTGVLDPLQQAFIDNTGYQCGYCTPGMLMTAKSLLNENPHPSEDDVRHHLRGNVCRCTGYASIVRAVLDAAGKVDEESLRPVKNI